MGWSVCLNLAEKKSRVKCGQLSYGAEPTPGTQLNTI